MPSRLNIALALSLALHGALLLPGALKQPTAAPPPAALLATLRLPPLPESPAAEPLLKNTLDDAPAAKTAKTLERPNRPEKPAAKTRPSVKREVKTAQKKIAQHLYYPPAAIAQGIEGEVRLLVTLNGDGSVADVSLAAGSGHAILDNAAIKAAYAAGKLGDGGSRELVLPVIFRLQ
ncbi:MAG: TonB family protein [Rhodocyclaceae bacterium]